MRVLVACEMSGRVTDALLELGVDAWSCDLLPTIGKHPERHIVGDCEKVLASGSWEALIAFPPCTHLSNVGQMYRRDKMLSGELQKGYDFFIRLWELDTVRLKCIENPLGIVSSQVQLDRWLPGRVAIPYSQILSWEQFGDTRKKRTCLWLQGLPVLLPTSVGDGVPCDKWFIGSCPGRSVSRSKISPYLARAMAAQWSIFLKG